MATGDVDVLLDARMMQQLATRGVSSDTYDADGADAAIVCDGHED